MQQFRSKMNAFRRLLGYRSDYKSDEDGVLDRFIQVDSNLTIIVDKIESLDGRRNPQEYNAIITQFRRHQSSLLNIMLYICSQFVPEEERPPRDFRIKFSEDILTDLLPGQLWFGAECLASGSNIPERDIESELLRPVALHLLETIESLRGIMRARYREINGEHQLPIELAEVSHDMSSLRIGEQEARLLRKSSFIELLKQLDSTLAHFEFCYVSALMQVKSMAQVDRLQEVLVIFGEALGDALHCGLIRQEAVDFCDPALMFAIPRIGIVRGLLISRLLAPSTQTGDLATWGPIDPDGPGSALCDMFAAYRKLLVKVKRHLLRLTPEQLVALQRQLCDIPSASTSERMSDSEADADSNSNPGPFDLETCNGLDAYCAPAGGSSDGEAATSSSAADPTVRRRRFGVSSLNRQSSSASTSNSKLSRRLRRMLYETAEEDSSSKHDTASDQSSSNSTAATLHRLFLCISGIADILQTTHAGDMRYILRSLFTMYAASDDEEGENNAVASVRQTASSATQNQTNATGNLPREDFEVAADALHYSWEGGPTGHSRSTPATNATSSSVNESQTSNARRAVQMSGVPVVYYHTARPEWVADDRVHVCFICTTKFTFFRRRHHCRNCGNIFCFACSRKRLVLKPAKRRNAAKRDAETDDADDKFNAVRVCDRCFNTLTSADFSSVSATSNSVR